jgi:DNA mismatch repair protein MutS
MFAYDHYLAMKYDHPDALVLVQEADFYETFDDDAVTAARDLDLVLGSLVGTGLLRRVPTTGFPCHIAENYAARLVARGHRVVLAAPAGTRVFYPEAGPLAVRGELARPVAPQQMRLPLEV